MSAVQNPTSPLLKPFVVLGCLLLLTSLAQCGEEHSRPAPPAVAGSPRLEAGLCSAAEKQADLGNAHQNDLDHQYPDHPATSGPHYPVPLPPQPAVYATEVPEARAVHNLEHGYVIVYYQPSGADALNAASLEAVHAAVIAQRRVLLAPYPNLPAGVGLALTAWRELQRCPGRVPATEAREALAAFVAAYRDSPAAPEPGAR